jgi:hypothetical protein
LQRVFGGIILLNIEFCSGEVMNSTELVGMEGITTMKTIATVRIVIIAAIIACACFDLKILAAAPIVGMTLYTWIGVRECRKEAEQLRALADQIYFTAYACTIAAFAGLVMRIRFTGRTLEQSSDLWLMAAFGVLCTVLGLLTMTTLHDFAAALSPKIGNAVTTVPNVEVREIHPPMRLDAYAEVVEGLISTCKAASDAIADLDAQVKTLKAAFRDVTRCAEGTKTAGETLQRSTVELQGVLDGFVRTLTIRFEVPDEPPTVSRRIS